MPGIREMTYLARNRPDFGSFQDQTQGDLYRKLEPEIYPEDTRIFGPSGRI